MRFYELKSKTWDNCVEEGPHVIVKNTKMKHVKRIEMLAGLCVIFASKEWCHQDAASSIKEEEINLELRIENVHQQERTGRALVVHATMDEKEEISTKTTNDDNENELGIKCVSFKWTSAKDITKTTRMNYCDKEDLRFEVLKGISINDVSPYEHDLASVK